MNATNHTEPVGIFKACEDIDECSNGNEDCHQVHFKIFISSDGVTDRVKLSTRVLILQGNLVMYVVMFQVCSNTPGSYQCSCRSGFTLKADNRTCVRTQSSGATTPSSISISSSSNGSHYSAAHRPQSSLTAYTPNIEGKIQ